jgi:hypothetical protein
MDEGIRGCPDGGKREYRPKLKESSMLWDNAPSHLPNSTKRSSPFYAYVNEVLGLAGIVHTPPYSPWFNPIELFFSYVKRYVRKYAPPDIPALLLRIREATAKITGTMIMNWFRKCGYVVPGAAAESRQDDPNRGVVDRCSLPPDAKFDRREHVSCVDKEGKVRRLKRTGSDRWNTY